MALPEESKRSPAEGELLYAYDWEPVAEVLTGYTGIALFVFAVHGITQRHVQMKQRQCGFDEATYL